MFNKTRRKIVFTVVSSLAILLAVTLATIYVSNRIALARQNEEMLRTYADRFSPDSQPGAREDGQPEGDPASDLAGDPGGRPGMQGDKPAPRDGEPGRDEPRFQLSTFYSVAFSDDGEVLSVNNGNNALQDESSLIEIASSILEGGETSGRSGSMTYLVDSRDGYTLVAMIDGTIGDSDLQTLFRQMLMIGGAAMIVLIVISIFISRRIVRPLEENDRRQKRFVSDAGHELKTPIAVISANSELLRREIGDSEWLGNIDYENERMSDLVKQLLTLSKAENGETAKETLDLSKLVSGEVLPFETLAFERGTAIESDIEPGLYIEGNANQLRQLVSIILDNALSHGTGDTISLSLRKERHNALLCVSNDANEMSDEELSHLFDRFRRGDEARSEGDSHYGLGLSIAQAVTAAHKGHIRAEYKNGKAIFKVSLPIKKN